MMELIEWAGAIGGLLSLAILLIEPVMLLCFILYIKLGGNDGD
jgi:hypothetical protein